MGRCFDLLDEAITARLAQIYKDLEQSFQQTGHTLPQNRGPGWKRRDLDCLVINDCLRGLERQGAPYDTVRGAFLEGEPVYPGAGFSAEGHVQIAVRNLACILGVFRPNL